MNITIISGSNREDSGSRKVADFAKQSVEKISHELTLWDMNEERLPLWTEDMWNSDSDQFANWQTYKQHLDSTDALIIVAAEWNGMVPSSLHNFVMHLGREVAHKPVLLVSVTSSQVNGTYPIVEMKAFANKNNRMLFVPDHVIVRDVNNAFVEPITDEKKMLHKRIEQSIDQLVLYAKHMNALREDLEFDYKQYGNGM